MLFKTAPTTPPTWTSDIDNSIFLTAIFAFSILQLLKHPPSTTLAATHPTKISNSLKYSVLPKLKSKSFIIKFSILPNSPTTPKKPTHPPSEQLSFIPLIVYPFPSKLPIYFLFSNPIGVQSPSDKSISLSKTALAIVSPASTLLANSLRSSDVFIKYTPSSFFLSSNSYFSTQQFSNFPLFSPTMNPLYFVIPPFAIEITLKTLQSTISPLFLPQIAPLYVQFLNSSVINIYLLNLKLYSYLLKTDTT